MLWIDEDKPYLHHKTYSNFAQVADDYGEEHPFREIAKHAFCVDGFVFIYVGGGLVMTKEFTDEQLETLGKIESNYKSFGSFVDVKCDKDNNSAEDMAKGIINITV